MKETENDNPMFLALKTLSLQQKWLRAENFSHNTFRTVKAHRIHEYVFPSLHFN